MNLWVLEFYDKWFECPVTVGIYTCMENARTARDIIVNQLKEKNLEEAEQRFDIAIVPVQADSFISQAISWIG